MKMAVTPNTKSVTIMEKNVKMTFYAEINSSRFNIWLMWNSIRGKLEILHL